MAYSKPSLKRKNKLASQIEVEDVPVQFKKKGNEQKFKFNPKILKANAKASRAMASGDTTRAKESLQEGTDLLNKRQELIKLADKSEFGWATINEHLDDELADDESDAGNKKPLTKPSQRGTRGNLPGQISNLLAGSNWPSSFPSWPYFRPSSGRLKSSNQKIFALNVESEGIGR